jgi:hypothetical protein
VTSVVDLRGVCGVLVEKLEGKRQLGRPGRRCEDNIKVDFHEVEWGRGMAWIDLDQDRGRAIVNAVMNFWIP